MSRLICFLLALALMAASGAEAFTIGMVGDSLTDDYLGGSAPVNNDLAALSWGQILAAKRGNDVDFGAERAVGDPWDNVRYAGSETNWATSGGVASDNAVYRIQGFPTPLPVTVAGTSYLSTQVAGLATQIASGQVSTAYIGIGSNDFFYHTSIFSPTGSFTPNPAAVIDQAFIDDVLNSILSGVDTLLAAGSVDLLLGLLPQGTAGGSNPDILAGISAVNQGLLQGAAARGIATVNGYGWFSDPSRVDASGSISVGNLVIPPGPPASAADLSPTGAGPCNSAGECATPSHALHFTAEDGIHPNTIIQGLIANEIIDALNSNFGHQIAPLSDTEILELAGVPEPHISLLLVFGVLALRRSTSSSRRS